MVSSLLETCAPSTRLCVAADLTMASESVATKSIADWRRSPPTIGKRPAVFLLLAHHR
jgi:16S rRNA (cytidine1402-2'-O)-methyltransferase